MIIGNWPNDIWIGPCVKIRQMAVNPELLKILVCPLCKAPVNLTESGQGLKCSQCRRVYPIRDDIPVMLISEAKIED
jgi:uncharacterized protein